MQELIVFNNDLFGDVRFIEVEGKPYAIGIDIAIALGYSNASKAVSTHCKNGIKEMIPHSHFGNVVKTQTTLIPESDIYRLIFKSKLPQAEKFEKWVMEEVLPQIRQTGGYIPVKEEDDEKTILAKALLIVNKTLESKNQYINELECKMQEQEPYVEYAKSIEATNESISVGDFAKVLNKNGFNIGRTRMYNWLRENNILMSNNKPYQRYMDREYFEVIEYSYKTKEGEHLVFKTLITPKGQMYLAKKLIDKQD